MSTARDIVLAAVILFAIGIGLFVVSFVATELKDGLLNNTVINASVPGRTAISNGMSTVSTKMDYLFTGVFVGILLAMIITSWFVAGHPIFMIIYFIVIVVAVPISAILANVWERVTTHTGFGTTINNFPITDQILTNLPIYMCVIALIALVIMFAKPTENGG